MGVWVEGAFSWLEGDGWTVDQNYSDDALVGDSIYAHSGLGIRLRVREGVHPRQPAMVREVRIESTRPGRREVRIFWNADFRLNETDIGDTAFYNPRVDGIVHYKASTAVLLGGCSPEGGLFEFTTGIKAFGDAVGTGPDAEDGHLGSNPISQGSVDSTLSVRTWVDEVESSLVTLWLVMGSSIEEVEDRFLGLGSARGIGNLLELSESYWRTVTLHDPHPVEQLSAAVRRMYLRSLQLIRTQCDERGAILAANDSDIMLTNRATYSFLWPRDGALVARVTDAAGQPAIARRFFEMCLRLLPRDRPFLLHKYAPDGTLGASWHSWLLPDGSYEVPFQQDETALTVWAMGRHLREFLDADCLVRWFEDFVAPCCDFMDAYRDGSGLPMPSHDLWEERRGVHAYTVATTIVAFREAAWMASLLGDPREWEYARVAEDLTEAAWSRLWDDERGLFWRQLDDHGHPDPTVDAAVLAFVTMGVVPPEDPRAKRLVDAVESALRLRGGIDGVARYQGDYYFRRVDHFPGNPWVICTMWLAQARLLMATRMEEVDLIEGWLEWATHRQTSTGVLSEQYHPETGEPLSVSPLTWSHAEVAATVQLALRRRAELGV